ncbi:MAG: hypothetical protein ICV60_08975 [Pyrinomonadaceae bacterium]|nr:hypothetical protein [Pyrinomonadaceae bacterium]
MRFQAEGKRSPFAGRPLLSLSSFVLAVTVGLISSFTFSTAYDLARVMIYGQSPADVSGVWRGYWEGVPAVTVTLKQQGESLSGTAKFIRVINSEDGPQVAGESQEIPLINPRLQGNKLSFELYSLDGIYTAFVEMEMSFENQEEAELRSTRRDSADVPIDKEPPLRMRREPSF